MEMPRSRLCAPAVSALLALVVVISCARYEYTEFSGGCRPVPRPSALPDSATVPEPGVLLVRAVVEGEPFVGSVTLEVADGEGGWRRVVSDSLRRFRIAAGAGAGVVTRTRSVGLTQRIDTLPAPPASGRAVLLPLVPPLCSHDVVVVRRKHWWELR